jgi:hypothetical protein
MAAPDGEVVLRASHAVQSGQVLELVDVPSSRSRAGSTANLDFRLVHADEHILVVDKPAGMVVHPTSVVHGGTLSELAEARYGPLPTPQGEQRHGIVHRADAGPVLSWSSPTGEAGESSSVVPRARGREVCRPPSRASRPRPTGSVRLGRSKKAPTA